MAVVDPHRCPLCMGENQCALARGLGSCWCFTRPIPDEVLAKVPAEAQQLACVCQGCAFREYDPATVYEKMRAILKQRGG